MRQRYGLELCNCFGCDIREEVDLARLQAALGRVMSRHDILRSYYSEEVGNGPARLTIADSGQVALALLELGPQGWQQKAHEHLYAAMQEGNGRKGQPGARFTLCRLADAHFHLIGVIPSMNADGRSVVQFLSEVEAAYRGRSESENAGFSVQFRDIAAWLTDSADDALNSSAEAFWRSHLAEVPWDVELPIEKTLAREAAFRPSLIPWGLPQAMGDPASPRKAPAETWLKVQLITATAAWLSRLCGRQRIYLGVSFDGRGYEELSRAIGPFEKYIPVIADIRGATTFGQLTEVVRRQLEELSGWQEWFDLSFGDDESFKATELPAYPICVEVRRGGSRHEAIGPSFQLARLVSAADSYGIKLTCEVRGDRIQAEIHYNQAVYTAQAMGRVAQQLQSVLSLVGERPQDRVLGSSFLSPDERQRLIEPHEARPLQGCFHELFERQAESSLDAVSLVEGGLHVSYGCLNRLANRMAHRLRARVQAGPEILIAIRMPVCWQVQAAILAILKTGSAYVPLDPDWPRQRVDALLRDAGISAVLICSQPPKESTGSQVTQIDCDDLAEMSNPQLPSPNLAIRVDPDNLSYVLFTSGTSGTPKGVMITQRGFANYLTWAAAYYGIGTSRGAVVHSPVTFDFTLTCLLTPLIVGRTVFLCRSDSPLEGLANALSRLDEVGLIKLTPTSVDPLRRLLKAHKASCRIGCVVIGGEPLIGTRALRSLAQSTDALIVNEYGPTECVVGSIVYRIESSQPMEGPIPIGRPVANTGVRLSKPQGGPAETWTPGEIHISGWGVARGYLNSPALTADSFIPQSEGENAGERLYRSGDLARYLTSGDILYLSRRDSQVKIRGYRIEPAEVEAAIRSHGAVADCVVTVVNKADSHPHLIAFLVPDAKAEIQAPEIQSHLAAILPEYMMPLAFHTVPELPLTVNGKIDSKALQEALARADQKRKPAILPRTDAERTLHRLWREVLDSETISIDDNFFELGGDSILSIQVLARANQAGLRLRPKDMQDHPTILELSEVAAKADQASSAETVGMAGEVPLSPIQQRFFEWNLQDPSHYNQSVLLAVPKGWGGGHFDQAVRALVEHHDSLRLFFERDGSGHRQWCAKRCTANVVTFADCTSLSRSDWKRTIAALADQVQRSIRLDQAPLLRVVACSRPEPDSDLVYIVIHHLIVDHVSWTILLDDLRSALDQAAAGAPIAFPSKTASYRATIDHWRVRARQGDLRKEKAYWLSERWRQLQPLPTDQPDAASFNQVKDEGHVSASLGREETRALLHDTRAAYNTRTLDLLMTAYALAYAQWSASRTLAVDLESHGRHGSEGGLDASRTIGWYTSLYPVYLALTRPKDLGQSIREVKEALRQVPENGLGYGLLRYLGEDRQVRRACADLPAPGAVFNYLGDVGQAVAQSSPFERVGWTPAGNRSSRNQRPHLLEIGAYLSDGKLHLGMTYGSRVHRRSTVAGLAESFFDHLKALVAHCSRQRTRSHTPSDFPLAHLRQNDLNRVVAAHPGIEDIYPLSPTQKGMLFHSTRNTAAAPYLVQLCIRLSGQLKQGAFEESWRRVIARHTALRTSFLWESVPEPLQIVHQDVDIGFAKEDWATEGSKDARRRLDSWLEAQRSAGLDLTRAPLHRFALFRIGAAEFYFVWAYHHILLDGWSTSNVLREVLSGYEALTGKATPAERPARRYRDYIEWLLSKPWQETARYWRKAMAGVGSGTLFALPKPKARADHMAQPHGDELLALEGKDSEALAALASRLQVTANTVIQGAWAFVLSRYCGRHDVVFGVTVSGRPHDLPDVENRVGLFINTLPLRIRIDRRATVDRYLESVSRRLHEMLRHDHTPLVEIQRICRLPDRERLFDSILVFENYPMRFDFGALKDEIEVDAMWSAEQTNYPLTIVVGGQGTELAIKAVYDPACFEAAAVGQVLGHLRDTLLWMTRAHDSHLGECLASWSRRGAG